MIKRTVFIVQIENGCWLADWDWGDPSRTSVLDNAKQFSTRGRAEKAIEKARNDFPHRKLPDARVVKCVVLSTIREVQDEGN